MRKISKEILKTSANKLLFDMSDEQYDTLLKEFDVMIHQLDLMGNIAGVDSYTPMVFPFECSTSYLREDKPQKPLDIKDVLMNAASVEDNQIKIPKVVK